MPPRTWALVPSRSAPGRVESATKMRKLAGVVERCLSCGKWPASRLGVQQLILEMGGRFMENEVPSIVDKCTTATYDIPLVRVAVRAMDLHHPFNPRLRSPATAKIIAASI
jgi:hypothetical protein